MKLLSFLTLVLFSALSMAGSVSTGSYSQTIVSTGYSETSGEAIKIQAGAGISAYGEALNGRVDTYTRDDITITEFEGDTNTAKVTQVNGTSNGNIGSSVVIVEGSSYGNMNTDTSVDNLVSGTYIQFNYDATGFNYESGVFSESLESSTEGYEHTHTDFEADTVAAYTSYGN